MKQSQLRRLYRVLYSSGCWWHWGGGGSERGWYRHGYGRNWYWEFLGTDAVKAMRYLEEEGEA